MSQVLETGANPGPARRVYAADSGPVKALGMRRGLARRPETLKRFKRLWIAPLLAVPHAADCCAAPAAGGLPRGGITGNTRTMKTAISLPDELSEAIDACARELKMTRSGLLAKAAREFVAHRRSIDPTAAWNRAIEKAGQPGADPAAKAFRRRTTAIVRKSNRRER